MKFKMNFWENHRKGECLRPLWLGFPVRAGLVLGCCLLCVSGVGAAESSKLKVVVRPPIKKTLPQRPHAARPEARPVQSAEPLPAESVSIYRHVGKDGTVFLTNRPDGDGRYRLFGRFSTGRLMRAVGPDGVARLAERYAGRHGVEPRLIMAIIKAESGFDAKAVSSVGASGLMQLMPGTQRHLGVRDAFNPDENVEGGVRYFRSMLDRYGGNVSLALAAYNAGPANVDKYGGIPPFEETRSYVRRVLALYATP